MTDTNNTEEAADGVLTRDTIVRLAKQADEGFANEFGDMAESLVGLDAIERFARLVAVHVSGVDLPHGGRAE